MSITSRRALLGALAVVPAIAAPAVAAVANPDAHLLRLGRDLEAAQAVQEAAIAADLLADSSDTAAALQRADDALWAVEKAIFETKALTSAGCALKARFALTKMREEGCEDGEGTFGEALARSALADVVARA